MSNHVKDATRYLMDHLERSLYADAEYHKQTHDLKHLLGKLGIKSASNTRATSLMWGAPLQMESLEATLKQATFDSTHLSLWKKK